MTVVTVGEGEGRRATSRNARESSV